MKATMQFKAHVTDEHTVTCSHFIYVNSPAGLTYACRFGTRREAERVAKAMNNAWEKEGRLYEPVYTW